VKSGRAAATTRRREVSKLQREEGVRGRERRRRTEERIVDCVGRLVAVLSDERLDGTVAVRQGRGGTKVSE